MKDKNNKKQFDGEFIKMKTMLDKKEKKIINLQDKIEMLELQLNAS